MQKLKSLGVAILVILGILVVVAGAYVIYMIAAAAILLGVGTLVYKLSQWRSSWH